MWKIHTFPQNISVMWNASSLVYNLNSCRSVHFLRRYSLHPERLLNPWNVQLWLLSSVIYAVSSASWCISLDIVFFFFFVFFFPKWNTGCQVLVPYCTGYGSAPQKKKERKNENEIQNTHIWPSLFMTIFFSVLSWPVVACNISKFGRQANT